MPSGIYIRTREMCRNISLSKQGNNHPMWGKKRSENAKMKQSNTSKGHVVSEESRKKQSISMKRKWSEPGYKERLLSILKGRTYEEIYGIEGAKKQKAKLVKAHINIPLSEKHRISLKRSSTKMWQREGFKERSSLTRKKMWEDLEFIKKMDLIHKSSEYKLLQSLSSKKKWENSEYRKKISLIRKKMWEDPEHKESHIKAILQGLLKRPSLFEQKIIDLCFENNLPFIYKGNGSFLINYKNPDFVNEKDRIVIEVYYSYFKIRDYGSIENYQKFCREKYEPADWKVLFLDENDVMAEDWEQRCLDKIQSKIQRELV